MWFDDSMLAYELAPKILCDSARSWLAANVPEYSDNMPMHHKEIVATDIVQVVVGGKLRIPEFNDLLVHLKVRFNLVIYNSFLSYLQPDAKCVPHIDGKTIAMVALRIHIPLITTGSVMHILKNGELTPHHMEQDRIYQLNNRVLHYPEQQAYTRVHLITDMVTRPQFAAFAGAPHPGFSLAWNAMQGINSKKNIA
jgi:hypothetical protein